MDYVFLKLFKIIYLLENRVEDVWVSVPDRRNVDLIILFLKIVNIINFECISGVMMVYFDNFSYILNRGCGI